MLQLPLPSAVALPIWVAPSNSFTRLPAGAVPVSFGVVTLVMLSVLDAPESDAAIRSGVVGAAGAVVSMVSDKAPEATLTFPATSVAVALMLRTPWLRVELVMLQLPLPSAVALPIWVAPSNSFTRLPASAVPVKVGVVTLVMLSVLAAPESDAAIRSGVVGAAGAVVSTVKISAALGWLTLPAASVAVTV